MKVALYVIYLRDKCRKCGIFLKVTDTDEDAKRFFMGT